MNGTGELVPPVVVTVTFLDVWAAFPSMVKFAVMVVELTTVTPVTKTPPPKPPDTATVAPVTKLAPVKVTWNGPPPRVCEAGLIELSVGGGGLVTLKGTVLVVKPPVVTEMFLAVAGALPAIVSVAVMVFASETVTLLTVTPVAGATCTVDPVSSVEKLAPDKVTVVVLPRTADAGLTEAKVGGGTGVAVRLTGDPTMVLLAVKVNVPLLCTPVPGFGAVNTTPMVQDCVAASVAAQVPPAAPAARANPPVNVAVMPVSASPGLVRVTVCAALVVPCSTLPKLTTVGETFASGVLAPWNSTAPTSIAVSGLAGRGLP